MQVKHREPAVIDSDCELLLGSSSWDPEAQSIKYAWRRSDGGIARGGEVPVDALPQMLEFAIREGYLSLTHQAV